MNILNNLNLAKEAAIEAGKILTTSKANLNIEKTSDGKDIKLKADVEAEEIIKNHISNKSNFPMLGEETGKSVEDLGRSFWVIDPLDGTANYSRGIPICCVSIALIHDMQPVIGVIYDFNNNDLYFGHQKSKAFVNDQAIQVS